MTWKVNGTDLDTATVKVMVEVGSAGRAEDRRVQSVPLAAAAGTTRRHSLGRNLPAYALRFRFVGPPQARAQRIHFLRQQVLADFTLEAPPAPNEFYFEGGDKTATFSPDRTSQDFGAGIDHTGLQLQAFRVP